MARRAENTGVEEVVTAVAQSKVPLSCIVTVKSRAAAVIGTQMMKKKPLLGPKRQLVVFHIT